MFSTFSSDVGGAVGGAVSQIRVLWSFVLFNRLSVIYNKYIYSQIISALLYIYKLFVFRIIKLLMSSVVRLILNAKCFTNKDEKILKYLSILTFDMNFILLVCITHLTITKTRLTLMFRE